MPFDKLPQPAKHFFISITDLGLLLVPPMRGHTIFRETMHVFRPNLKFNMLPLWTQHRRMERLI